MQNGARGKRANALREASREVNKGEIDSEARRDRDFGSGHDHVLAAGRSDKRAHNDVTHSGGPGLTGLPTSIADPSAHSSEATTGGSHASDSFDRGKQRAGSLIHRGARVLMRNMAHETRDGGEPPARTLAAPVVAITERRKGGHGRWRSRVRQNRSSHARLNSCNGCTRKRVRMREVNNRRKSQDRRGGAALVGPHDMWAHWTEQTETRAPV